MDLKENVKNPATWLRGLFIIIFGAILYFVFILVWLLVAFQFFSKLVTGNVNRQLADFNAGLLRYITQVLGYITFQSDEQPFPFQPWPGEDKTAPAPRPRPGRRTTRSPARGKKEGS